MTNVVQMRLKGGMFATFEGGEAKELVDSDFRDSHNLGFHRCKGGMKVT